MNNMTDVSVTWASIANTISNLLSDDPIQGFFVVLLSMGVSLASSMELLLYYSRYFATNSETATRQYHTKYLIKKDSLQM